MDHRDAALYRACFHRPDAFDRSICSSCSSQPSIVKSGDPSSPGFRQDIFSRGIGRKPRLGKVAPRWCIGVP
ncbi:MAG: hypothetical protein ACOX1P_00305 [Thermoguttaceae bacterium]